MSINTFILRETRVVGAASYVGESGVESIAVVGPSSGKSPDLAIVGVSLRVYASLESQARPRRGFLCPLYFAK